MKVLLNLGKEVKAFTSFGEFAEVMDQVVALARQAEAWRRATVANNVPEPTSGPASSRGRDAGVQDVIPCGPPPAPPRRHKNACVGPSRSCFRGARRAGSPRGCAKEGGRDVQRLERQLQQRQGERLWNMHPIARAVLARRGGRITRRLAMIRPAASFAAQVAQLRRGTAVLDDGRRAVLLVQVGRFVEAPLDGWRLGLRRRWVGRRRAWGMPWRAAAWLIERGLARGYAVAVALEQPEACGNVKRRQLAYLFERPTSEQPKTRESP